MKKDVCKNCKFYDQTIKPWKNADEELQEGHGYCRVESPQRAENGSGVFPFMDDSDWCGKFKNRSAANK